MAAVGLPEADRITAFRKFTENNIAFHACYATLLNKHPNEWVAFHDGEVRATGRSLTEVLERADRAGVPRKIMYLHYMDPDPAVMIL